MFTKMFRTASLLLLRRRPLLRIRDQNGHSEHGDGHEEGPQIDAARFEREYSVFARESSHGHDRREEKGHGQRESEHGGQE